MCRVQGHRCIATRGATHSGLTKCRCAIVHLEVELGATIAIEAMVLWTAAALDAVAPPCFRAQDRHAAVILI